VSFLFLLVICVKSEQHVIAAHFSTFSSLIETFTPLASYLAAGDSLWVKVHKKTHFLPRAT